MKPQLSRWHEHGEECEDVEKISWTSHRHDKSCRDESWIKIEKDDRFKKMVVPIFPIPVFSFVDGDLRVQLHSRLDRGGTMDASGWVSIPDVKSVPMVGKILLGGELIGYIEGYHLDGTVARMHSMYLNAEYRGKKHGTRVIALLVKNAVENRMELFVLEDVLDKKNGDEYTSNPAKFAAMIGKLMRGGLVTGWKKDIVETRVNYILQLVRSSVP